MGGGHVRPSEGFVRNPSRSVDLLSATVSTKSPKNAVKCAFWELVVDTGAKKRALELAVSRMRVFPDVLGAVCQLVRGKISLRIANLIRPHNKTR